MRWSLVGMGWTRGGHWWTWAGHVVDIGGHAEKFREITGHGVEMRWTLVDMLERSARSAQAGRSAYIPGSGCSRVPPGPIYRIAVFCWMGLSETYILFCVFVKDAKEDFNFPCVFVEDV